MDECDSQKIDDNIINNKTYAKGHSIAKKLPK